MIFNSIAYLLFLPSVVLLHFALPHRHRWLVLLVASYFFYMSWNASYLVLILAATLVNYAAGLAMPRLQSSARRGQVLVGALVVSLGILFVFKYWNFAAANLRDVSLALGLGWMPPELEVLLPVGISFYTFQTLSYTIDVYRGAVHPEPHFGRFAVYVSFFPQLVAGPIERAGRLLPQFDVPKHVDWARIVQGAQILVWGLFKKVVIADRLALYVDAVYGNVGEHGPATHLLATYAFAFQIYCDFSGYTDIALGSARMLGFELTDNFRTPYFATTIRDFWRRWHISLSTWLRDYLYIPLGGNRKGSWRTYENLAITMLLGGLWHGASWNFVIWGGLHGVLLAGSRGTEAARSRVYARYGIPPVLRDALRMAITFHLVCLAWVFFRADTTADAMHIITGLFAGDWTVPFLDLATLAHGAVGVAILLVAQVHRVRRGPFRQVLAGWPLLVRWSFWYLVLMAIVLLGVDGGSQFIYFQF